LLKIDKKIGWDNLGVQSTQICFDHPAGPSLGGWHLGTVPNAPRPKGAPRYGGDRCNGRSIQSIFIALRE